MFAPKYIHANLRDAVFGFMARQTSRLATVMDIQRFRKDIKIRSVKQSLRKLFGIIQSTALQKQCFQFESVFANVNRNCIVFDDHHASQNRLEVKILCTLEGTLNSATPPHSRNRGATSAEAHVLVRTRATSRIQLLD